MLITLEDASLSSNNSTLSGGAAGGHHHNHQSLSASQQTGTVGEHHHPRSSSNSGGNNNNSATASRGGSTSCVDGTHHQSSSSLSRDNGSSGLASPHLSPLSAPSSTSSSSAAAPRLTILRQTSLAVEKFNQDGVQKNLHVVVKNNPFILDVQVVCPDQNNNNTNSSTPSAFSSAAAIPGSNAVALDFHKITLEAYLLYDCDDQKEVVCVRATPLSYKGVVNELDPTRCRLELQIAVLSSQHEDMNFRVRLCASNTASKAKLSNLSVTSEPIQVISKPEVLHKKRKLQQQSLSRAAAAASSSSSSSSSALGVVPSSLISKKRSNPQKKDEQLVDILHRIEEMQQKQLRMIEAAAAASAARPAPAPVVPASPLLCLNEEPKRIAADPFAETSPIQRQQQQQQMMIKVKGESPVVRLEDSLTSLFDALRDIPQEKRAYLLRASLHKCVTSNSSPQIASDNLKIVSDLTESLLFQTDTSLRHHHHQQQQQQQDDEDNELNSMTDCHNPFPSSPLLLGASAYNTNNSLFPSCSLGGASAFTRLPNAAGPGLSSSFDTENYNSIDVDEMLRAFLHPCS